MADALTSMLAAYNSTLQKSQFRLSLPSLAGIPVATSINPAQTQAFLISQSRRFRGGVGHAGGGGHTTVAGIGHGDLTDYLRGMDRAEHQKALDAMARINHEDDRKAANYRAELAANAHIRAAAIAAEARGGHGGGGGVTPETAPLTYAGPTSGPGDAKAGPVGAGGDFPGDTTPSTDKSTETPTALPVTPENYAEAYGLDPKKVAPYPSPAGETPVTVPGGGGELPNAGFDNYNQPFDPSGGGLAPYQADYQQYDPYPNDYQQQGGGPANYLPPDQPSQDQQPDSYPYPTNNPDNPDETFRGIGGDGQPVYY